MGEAIRCFGSMLSYIGGFPPTQIPQPGPCRRCTQHLQAKKPETRVGTLDSTAPNLQTMEV